MNIENICFEGGGVLAFAYCGAIQELEKKGVLNHVKRFAGTSAGAVFAMFLAMDITVDEILKFIKIINLNHYEMGCWISTVYKIWNNYGIFTTDNLESQIRKFIAVKINPDITFKELMNISGKELVIVSTNYDKMKPVFFHHAQYPNVKVIDALMLSISVPFVFQPKKYTLHGTEYNFVDGGMTENYPIWIFNDMTKLYDGNYEKVVREPVNKKTLGLKLLGVDQTNDYTLFTGINPSNTVPRYGIGLINILMTQLERVELSPSLLDQTIAIKTDNMFFLDFKITRKMINTLIRYGRDAVIKYY